MLDTVVGTDDGGKAHGKVLLVLNHMGSDQVQQGPVEPFNGVGIVVVGRNFEPFNPIFLVPLEFNPYGIEPTGLNPTGLNPCGIQPNGIQPNGIQPTRD